MDDQAGVVRFQQLAFACLPRALDPFPPPLIVSAPRSLFTLCRWASPQSNARLPSKHVSSPAESKMSLQGGKPSTITAQIKYGRCFKFRSSFLPPAFQRCLVMRRAERGLRRRYRRCFACQRRRCSFLNPMDLEDAEACKRLRGTVPLSEHRPKEGGVLGSGQAGWEGGVAWR